MYRHPHFRMATTAFTIFATMALASAGQKQSPMVGVWKLVMSPELLRDIPKGSPVPNVTMTFKSNGTMSGLALIGKQKSTMGGTWKLQGNSLTVKTTHEDGKRVSKSKTMTLSKDKRSFPLPEAEGMAKMVKIR